MYNKRKKGDSSAVLTAFRRAGLIIVAMQLTYILATIFTDLIVDLHTPYNANALVVSTITILSLIVLDITLGRSVDNNSKVTKLIKMTLFIYYLSAIAFSICISSVYRDAALALMWTVVLSTTGIMLGVKPFIVGSTVMASSTIINGAIYSYDVGHILSLAIVVLLTVYASYLFYRYREAGLIDLRNYNNLKYRERIQSRRIKALVNSIKDALVSVSTSGEIKLYNPAALDLLNTNIDINNKRADDLFELVNENNEKVLLSDITREVKTYTERTDLRLSYGDKDFINIQLSIIPIKSHSWKNYSDLDGYIIMMSDITKRKSLEDERDEFIGVVSHELRTPVAIAEGTLSNIQFLLEKGGDPKVLASTLDSAHQQILYLGQMVNDLSTLSRAERGVYMDYEDIDLETFLTGLQAKYNQDANDRNLKLNLDLAKKGVISLPTMVIEEIMQNFITNAIKYTEKGSVTIGTKSVRGDKNSVEIYVADTGIGISKPDIEHVFQKFWRSEDYRTRKTNGTGLGLHVVDQLSAKVGLQINVKSKINEGSTFSFVLPVKTEQLDSSNNNS